MGIGDEVSCCSCVSSQICARSDCLFAQGLNILDAHYINQWPLHRCNWLQGKPSVKQALGKTTKKRGKLWENLASNPCRICVEPASNPRRSAPMPVESASIRVESASSPCRICLERRSESNPCRTLVDPRRSASNARRSASNLHRLRVYPR